jgi:exosome complex exonuclease RRP6
MFESTSPISPDSFDNTPFEWVSTPEALAGMLEDLRHVQEIAIDLEHHDYRTYGGFVCLMQVSTRNKDWIVDTLVLRDELEDLNEVFTDPKIVKVLFSAYSNEIKRSHSIL